MNKKLKYLVFIAIFSALAMVLTLFRFPLPFLPPFYKLDFSEAVVVLGGFYLGPVATIIIQLLKNLLKIIFSSTNSMFVGDLANFIMGVSFCLPATLIYKKSKNLKGILLGLLTGTLCLTIVGCVTNYFIVIPMYASIYKMEISAIVAMGTKLNPNITNLFNFVCFATAPFNIIKGVLSSIIVYLTYLSTKKLFK